MTTNFLILNSIGLLSDIAGVSILFFYGFPQPSVHSSDGPALLLSGDVKEKLEEETKVERRKYVIRSTIGLILLISGFSLQIIANWVGYFSL